MPYPQLQFASDRSLLVIFGEGITLALQASVERLCGLIQAEAPADVCNLHPAYNSLLISFDPLRVTPHGMLETVHRWLAAMESFFPPEPRRIEIPVCYGTDFGPDLESVAEHAQMTCDEAAALHSSLDYFVYFLGFSPGFPYLGDLPQRLATPRLPSPRTRVPAGSVAIGGSQTGVYPVQSPGGWRIIGRTPLALFLPDQTPPTLLRMGDTVRFYPITRREFEGIGPR